ncbi:hypothetical protein DPMN_009420 [Dreissena polymorpha]|uniref:Uncharacterized protein n=1 Tax=Dreissena polymorpha TaxID=45954 RepID=A0A9D4MWW6_DREPO|nr:hypothetical protein DPMN_009420 [Dreissena polymorpha]
MAANAEVSVGGPCSENSTKDVPSEKSLLKPVDVVDESLVWKVLHSPLRLRWAFLYMDHFIESQS